ncbi:uridine kinase [Eubacteriales bacterium OttesenSCG-928-M02]|nr:uridine kinase [Eubacteriales bacterium OttesenSCG-928-M02]
MIVVGICGGSGSGKSTLAHLIAQRMDCKSYVLGMDCYYRNNIDLPFEERALLNYDSPRIFEFDELIDDIEILGAGNPIKKKGYDFSLHLRADSEEEIAPPDVLLVEGIHCFYDDRLMDLYNLKVFMQVDPDICILRRLVRDVNERGRTIDGVIKQYLSTVKPMYERYIKNYAALADFAVTNGGRNEHSLKAITSYLNTELAAQE